MVLPSEGADVCVVGSSGNVGKLVALRLSDSFKVTGVSRNPSRVRDFLPSDKVELAQADLDDPAALEKALAEVEKGRKDGKRRKGKLPEGQAVVACLLLLMCCFRSGKPLWLACSRWTVWFAFRGASRWGSPAHAGRKQIARAG